MGNSEEWQVLNIRIVLGRVGYDVVDIVASLPPAQTQTSKPVGNKHANDRVDLKVVSDTHMSSIMSGKDQLVPENAQKDSAGLVPAPVQCQEAHAEEKGIAGNLDHVRRVVTLVQALVSNTLME